MPMYCLLFTLLWVKFFYQKTSPRPLSNLEAAVVQLVYSMRFGTSTQSDMLNKMKFISRFKNAPKSSLVQHYDVLKFASYKAETFF